MNASRLAFDSHVHIPFLNYFCFRNSGENGGKRNLRGSPRDCRYDTVISVIPVIPVVWVGPFVPNSLVSPARARLSACFKCKNFPICTCELVLHASSGLDETLARAKVKKERYMTEGTKLYTLKEIVLARLDCLGGIPPSLSINCVTTSKDMEKRLPQLNYIKMKISYDLGFITIRVTMAT